MGCVNVRILGVLLCSSLSLISVRDDEGVIDEQLCVAIYFVSITRGNKAWIAFLKSSMRSGRSPMKHL
ncbi:hypothetical protein I7I53_10474 [Histoplasma capsulatum var. duboisii H88]|uniref:Secreted protein n=1 Tax=Ajellomyces capsulatus (strain H88) TaxID=544711 RepID=A0A8A1L8J6_AJEC8|nr:hypothetical protein I7I53_10474 [Histoplasma capsulatum var. duboisii H88]